MKTGAKGVVYPFACFYPVTRREGIAGKIILLKYLSLSHTRTHCIPDQKCYSRGSYGGNSSYRSPISIIDDRLEASGEGGDEGDSGNAPQRKNSNSTLRACNRARERHAEPIDSTWFLLPPAGRRGEGGGRRKPLTRPAIRELSPSLTTQFRSITIVVTVHCATRLSTRSPLIGFGVGLPGFDSARRSAASLPEARCLTQPAMRPSRPLPSLVSLVSTSETASQEIRSANR